MENDGILPCGIPLSFPLSQHQYPRENIYLIKIIYDDSIPIYELKM